MLENRIKIVFFDIDWTLYDHRTQQFIESGIRSIKKLRKKGILVYLATARSMSSIRYMNILDLIEVDGIIAYNGGYVITKNKEVLIKTKLKKKVIEDLISLAKENDLSLHLIEEDEAYLVTPYNKDLEEYSKAYKEERLEIKEYDPSKEIMGAIIYAHRDRNIDNYFDKIKTHRFRYCKLAVEFLDTICLKGDGVKAVLDYHGLSKDEAMCFGDNFNDIDMFNNVTWSVAVGNAKQELKDVAWFVTTPIEKHGIRKALKKFKVI